MALRDAADSAIYHVARVSKGTATVRKVRHPDGSRLSAEEEAEADPVDYADDALVVIADFGEPIYPGLRPLGSVDRGGDKPAHVVIKGENHHVLEALQFTHAGKVDCIYIDPPYNTGARDWKYDNNYVDDTDGYRHSKWLAFMERRLLLAKELLNLQESVLIVTIDEKELHRLALLLEQLFPSVTVQTVAIVVSPSGQTRRQELDRVNEYALFLFFGRAHPHSWTDDLLNDVPADDEPIRWESLLRSGTNSRRQNRPALFFPIFLEPKSGRIVDIGDSKPPSAGLDDWGDLPGAVAIWPTKADGTQATWQSSPEYLRSLLAKGFVRVGKYNPSTGKCALWYLGRGRQQQIEAGAITVTGSDSSGAVIIEPAFAGSDRSVTAKTVWNRSAHHSGWHGSALVRSLLSGRSFPFPKSLYAVEDTLRIAVGSKPEALVLDFFGGSGTTAHAVARLNRQDGGQRQSIVITNNEVSAAEADSLRTRGHRPGDPEWEALGIFEHITRPRVTAAVTGLTPDGEPIKGDYKFTDEFPMADGFEENVSFVELVYLDPDDVELDLAFAAVAPLLWLRAGAHGPVIDERIDAAGRRKAYAWTERYGVLFNPDRWRGFVEKLPEMATTAFVVTDSQAIFAGVAAELPGHLDVVRLYENYLTTFRINQGQL